jgi:crotonobetainyl-CoA:carnitine CoA-transferase CaiB-like acyl-CoA transferase
MAANNLNNVVDGLTVLDLSRVLAGPYCTQVLADHGAEVIKVESPIGDHTRYWGPPSKEETAAYFTGLNRNKRSISIDLNTKDGKDILLKLIESADVLIENFKPGTMEKWGLGYEDVLKDRFPALVYCKILGFGENGPLGGLPGYDAVIQAISGLMSINGEENSTPLRIGIPIVDIACGLYASVGILMALNERANSGVGQLIDIALFDTALSILHPHAANFLMSGTDPIPSGNAHPNISPYDKFPTRTCDIYLGIGNDSAFRSLCAHLKVDSVADDPRFGSNEKRVLNKAALRSILVEALKDLDGQELADQLLRIGLAAGPVRTVREALASEQAISNGCVLEADEYRGVSTPLHMQRPTASGVKRQPPQLGQHTREVLVELGFDSQQIGQLIADAVVKDHDA